MNSFPDICIRGVSDPNTIKDDWVSQSVFCFEYVKREEDGTERAELSVNWVDDAGAYETLINQKRNGKIQFSAGFFEIVRKKYDTVAQVVLRDYMLSYERQPVDGNKYHGNLLINVRIPDYILAQIKNTLALSVKGKIVKRSDYEKTHIRDCG